MSKAIDERIVSMQFDNKNFEQNVATSIGTLEKLKQSLNFKNASKGLEDINSAAKNCNMSGLSGAVDTVRMKFSALEVMGVTALANITNQAVNAGKKLVSSLTIEPIKTGFQEYETQINAVQTILANTSSKGTTLDQVNKALDELNVYADKTIYNFTEMTRNIGTFTAAGVDLETSVNAIQGIANLAAVSGSTSQQASTAMYQLSQALASGTVKLMDWNSVVNAGMGGEVFQNALKETSKLLGTGAEAAIKAEGSFRESLKTGWLTSEVLTETLKKFTTSGANEYIAKYTGLSEEAVQAEMKVIDSAKDEAAAIDSAAESLAKKSGKNKEEIKSALEMAYTAQNAATKVKTFTQLMDTLKESVQSGWSQTWKLLFGDFEEAKSLFTGISDFLTGDNGIITKMSNARNKLLEGALGKTFESLSDKINTVIAPAKKAAKVIEDLDDIVNRVIKGEFGNSDTGRYEKLAEAGYNYCKVQNKVNETLGSSVRFTDEQIAAQDKLLGTQSKANEATGEQATKTTELNEASKERLKALVRMTDEEAKAAGLTEEQIEALKELVSTAEKLGIPVDEFIDNLDQINGRWILLNGFKNIGKSIVTTFTALGQAYRDIFPAMTSDRLFDIIGGFHKLTSYLVINEDNAEKLKTTFKGLFAALDIVRRIVGGGLSIAFKVLKGFLSAFGFNILDVTSAVGEAIIKFREWFIEHDAVTKAATKFGHVLAAGVKKIKQWIEAFLALPEVQKAIEKVRAKLAELKQVGIDALDSFKNGFQNGVKSIPELLIQLGKDILNAIRNVLGIHSPSTEMYAIGKYAIVGFGNGIKDGVSALLETVKGIGSKFLSVFQSIDWGKLLSLGISAATIGTFYKLAGAIGDVGAALSGFGNVLDELGDGIQRISKAKANEMNSEALKNFAISIGILVASLFVLSKIPWEDLWPAGLVLITLAGVLIGLSFAMNKLNSAAVTVNKGGLNISGLKSSLIGIGIAVLLLAATVKLIGTMEPEQAKQGFKYLAGIVISLLVFTVLYGKLVKGDAAANAGKFGKMLTKLAVSMLLLILVMKLVARLDSDEIGKGIIFIAGFVIFVKAITKAVKGLNGDVSKVGSMLLKLSIAMALMVGVVKLISLLDYKEMGKGAIFAAGFAVFVKMLIWATKTADGNRIAKIGGLMLSVSLALLMMIGVCKLAGTLTVGELVKGAACIVVFGLLIMGLIQLTKLTNEQQMGKVALTILAFAVAIGIMAGVTALLGLIDIAYLAKGIIVIGLLSLMMALMVKSAKGVGDIKGTLLMMVIAIGIMAAAVVGLTFLADSKPESMLMAAGVMVALMLAFALMTKSAKAVDTKDLIKSLIGMTVMLGLLAVFALALNELRLDNIAAQKEALFVVTAVMAAMSGLLIVVAKAGSIYASTGWMGLTGLIGMTAMLALFIGFAAAINAIPMDNIAGKKEALIVLTAVMAAMSVLLVVVAAVGAIYKATGWMGLTGLIGLTAMVVPLAAFALALNYLPMDNIAGKKEALIVLTAVMAAMSVLLVVVAAVGAIYAATAGIAMLGLVGMLVMLGLFVGFAAALNAIPMDNIASSEESLILITKIMGELTLMLIALSIVAPLALIAVGAIGAFVGLVAIVGAIAAFVGKIMENNESFKNFVGNGLDMMIQVADGIGGMINSLVDVKIDSEVIDAVKTLAEVIMILSAASLVQGISSIFSIFTGSSSLGTFADQFGLLGKGLSNFAAEISTLTPAQIITIQCAASAIKILAEAAREIPNSGGLIGSIVGNNDMGTFAAQFPTLGRGLRQFLTNVGTFTDAEISTVRCAVDAIKILAEASSEIPNTGGLLGEIVGNNDLSAFAVQFPTLGRGLRQFLTNVGTFSDEQVDTVKAAAEAIKSLAEASSEIPNTGGLLGAIVGDNDLEDFAEQFPSLGTGLASFLTNVGTFTDAQVITVETAARAIKALAEASAAVPNTGGWLAKIIGDNELGSFAEQFPNVGTGVAGFVEKLGTFTKAQVSTVYAGASALRAIVELGKLDLSSFAYNVKTLGTNLSTFGGQLSTFCSKINEIGLENASNASKIINKFKDMINKLGGIDENAASTFKKSIKTIGESGFKNFIEAFNGEDVLAKVKDAATTMFNKFTGSLDDKKKDATKAGEALATAVSNGIKNKDSKSQVKTAGEILGEEAADGADDAKTGMEDAGKDLGSGLVTGIEAKEDDAYDAGFALGQAAVQGEKDGQDSNSPSKATIKSGKWFGEGLVIGINKMSKAVYNSGYDMGKTATSSITEALSHVQDLLDSDIGSQPTIRPVLDLSDVSDGASRIGNMLNLSPSVGVMDNLGAVSFMMNRRNQNGSISDVVSELNELGKKLDNAAGDTYSINGVNYNEGDDVAEAIKTIVRAAIIERRV